MSVIYTAPTAVRMFMKAGEQWSAKCNLKSLRLLGTVGEPINPEAWMWYRKNYRQGRAPDHGHLVADRNRHFINSPLPITPLKPGSCTMPLPGYNTDSLGRVWKTRCPLAPGGNIVIMTPYPTMLRDFYKDPARYHEELLGALLEGRLRECTWREIRAG